MYLEILKRIIQLQLPDGADWGPASQQPKIYLTTLLTWTRPTGANKLCTSDHVTRLGLVLWIQNRNSTLPALFLGRVKWNIVKGKVEHSRFNRFNFIMDVIYLNYGILDTLLSSPNCQKCSRCMQFGLFHSFITLKGERQSGTKWAKWNNI